MTGQFNRRWADLPPPTKKKRRPGKGRRFSELSGNNYKRVDTLTHPTLQAAKLDRAADLRLSLSRHRAAERLSHAAAAMRGVA